MSKQPAFQLYAADFYMDTASWPVEEVGMYTRLLFYQWVNGSIPNDLEKIARISGCVSERKWRTNVTRMWSNMCTKFVTLPDGNLVNKRLEETRRKQDEYREKQIESGRLGGLRAQERRRVGSSEPSSDASSKVPSENEALQSSTSSLTPKESKEPYGSLSESEKPASDGNGKYPPCPHEIIIETYHTTLPELPRVKHWPENLQAILRTRWKEDPVRQNLAWWEKFFRYVHESDFLMGRTREAFTADLEWLVRPKNFTKIANGRYHRTGSAAHKAHPGIAAWLEERQHAEAR